MVNFRATRFSAACNRKLSIPTMQHCCMQQCWPVALHVTYWFIFQPIVQINNVRLIAIQSHDVIDPTHYMYWLLCVPLNYTFQNHIRRNRGAGTPQNCKNSHKKWLWPKLQCALCEPSLLPLPFQYYLPMPLQKGFFWWCI